MTRGVLSVLMSVALLGAYTPAVFAGSESQLNFKIYSPETNGAVTPASPDAPAPIPADTAASSAPAADTAASSTAAPDAPAPSTAATSSNDAVASDKQAAPDAGNNAAAQPTAPQASVSADNQATAPQSDTAAQSSTASDTLKMEAPATAAPTESASQPTAQSNAAFDTSPATSTNSPTDSAAQSATTATTPTSADTAASTGAIPETPANTGAIPETTATPDASAAAATAGDGKSKVLQGYVRVVPKDTKIPIIMDTAVDSDTSQEGDEFEARTSEDLTIDGQIAVPAGSVIKGRIAQLNAPRRLNRNGSVALKFDTVTTPDNRQIPLVANLVAHGGVVHARRGLKDIAIDCGTFALPTAAGLAIGALAGNANKGSTTSSTHITAAGGALIGAGVGAAVGIAVLLAKKGQRIDVRPGDELKIELAEDLRMPMM